MYHILPTLLIPLLILALALEGCYLLSGKTRIVSRIPLLMLPQMKPASYCMTIFSLTAAVQIITYLLLHFIIMNCTAGAKQGLPGLVMLVISICWTGAVFLRLWCTKRTYRRLGAHLAILCAVLTVLEIGLFNAKSLGSFESEELNIRKVIVTSDTDFTREDGITLKENSKLLIKNFPEYTRALEIEAYQPERQRMMRVQVAITDDNFKDRFTVVADRFYSGLSESLDVSFVPYGTLRQIQLEVTDIHDYANIRSITASNKIPFRFSAARFLILLLLIGLILAVRETGFNHVTYDRKRRSHRIAVIAMTAVCTMSFLLFIIPKEKLLDYPVDPGFIAISDPYIQNFDALEHGRGWIDMPADERLETLENVYDNEERISSGIPAAWDRAYYNGKYYSYFGITPVLTIYYPFWFIFGKLPTMPTAISIYAAVSALAMCLLLLTLVRLFVPEPNFLAVLLMLPAAVVTCGCFYMQQYPGMYTVPFAAGITFLLLALYLGHRATLVKIPKIRYALLAASGLAVGLCAGSRPGMAIGCLALTPAFVCILLDKQFTVKYRIAQAAAFLTPALLCAAGLMYWNYIRFDNPLDFGASYQLTVSDIHANHLQFSMLFAGIFQNLFQPLELTNQFPYFHVRAFYMANYGMYSYAEGCFGALWIPLLGVGTFLAPHGLRMQGDILKKVRLRGFVICCIAFSVLLAWMDLCMGGTTVRYIFDFVPLLTMSSSVVLLRNMKQGSGLLYRVCIYAIALTFVLMLVLTWADSGAVSHHNFPQVYDIAEDLFTFWS